MGSRLTFAFSLMWSALIQRLVFQHHTTSSGQRKMFKYFYFCIHIPRSHQWSWREVWFIWWPFYLTCSGINPVKLIESDSARQMGWFLFTLSRYLDNYFTKTISFWQNKTVIKCYFAQSLPVFSSTGNWPFYFWAHSLNENGIDPLSSLPRSN